MQNSLSQMVGNSSEGDVPDLFSTMFFIILLQVKVFILIFRGYANAHRLVSQLQPQCKVFISTNQRQY